MVFELEVGNKNNSLSINVSKLYLDSETADVYFVFNEKKMIERVPAHKSLLAVGSDAFKAMFYGDMKEQGDVTIVDSTADAFKEFLQIFYLNRVKLTEKNMFDVVNLCKKYVVADFLNICEQFLEDTLTENNVFFVYNIAILFDLKEVKKMCKVMVAQNTTAAFKSESFLECPKSIVADILKLDELSCPETKVFEACMAWVKAASEKEPVTKKMVQEHLGDLFYQIRFGAMKFKEFFALMPLYGNIFSRDEYQEIRQIIGSKYYQPKLFNEKRRLHLPPWDTDAIIECSLTDLDGWFDVYCIQNIESTKFSTDVPFLLGELVCVTVSFESINEFPIQMKIFEYSDMNTPEIVFAQKVILKNHTTPNIVLQKPVLIKPWLKYEIQFKPNSIPIYGHFASALSNFRLTLTYSDIPILLYENDSFRGFITALKYTRIPSKIYKKIQNFM